MRQTEPEERTSPGGLSVLTESSGEGTIGSQPSRGRRLKEGNHGVDLQAHLDNLDRKQQKIDDARPLPPATLRSLEDDFTIRYAHATTAIEGNTLTLSETQVVLEKGITIGGKTVREHLEVLNMRDALGWLRDVVKSREPVTDRTILEMHGIIMAGILKEEAGFFRRQPVYIRGSDHVPPNWVKVPDLMKDLSERIDLGRGGEHPVVFAAQAHLELVRIHPFVDGNGRTARLLTNLLLMRSGYPPAMYSATERREYLDAIREADSGSPDRFIVATADAVEFMQDRYLVMFAQVEEAHRHADMGEARDPKVDEQ